MRASPGYKAPARCTLHTAHRTLHVARCTSHVARSTLLAALCLPHSALWSGTAQPLTLASEASPQPTRRRYIVTLCVNETACTDELFNCPAHVDYDSEWWEAEGGRTVHVSPPTSETT